MCPFVLHDVHLPRLCYRQPGLSGAMCEACGVCAQGVRTSVRGHPLKGVEPELYDPDELLEKPWPPEPPIPPAPLSWLGNWFSAPDSRTSLMANETPLAQPPYVCPCFAPPRSLCLSVCLSCCAGCAMCCLHLNGQQASGSKAFWHATRFLGRQNMLPHPSFPLLYFSFDTYLLFFCLAPSCVLCSY
jgi:hypothetical protein